VENLENELSAFVSNEGMDLKLFIRDLEGDIPDYSDDFLLILAREVLIRADIRSKGNYPWQIVDEDDPRSIDGNMIMQTGHTTIHLPFTVQVGDGQKELNELLDKFVMVPYIKMMVRKYKKLGIWEE